MLRKLLICLLGVFMLANNNLAQQSDVSLTVYNKDLALVKDIRTLSLKAGEHEVQFKEVASSIIPTSVHFKSLTAPDKVMILEQNFEFDLVNTTKLLQKYIDHELTVITKKNAYIGKLLSASGKEVMLQEASGTIRVINQTAILNLEFPKLPAGLMTRPTLVWTIHNQQAGKHKTEVSYLTKGISWHAEYVAVAKAGDRELELAGWISIENQSGGTYQNAKLKLVAGEVHQVQPKKRDGRNLAYAMRTEVAPPPQFKEKEFFEYHLYSLQRPMTVKNSQIKQISLFPAVNTKVKKLYIFDSLYDQKKIRVHLEFKNSKQDGLGMPLPGGKIRVYKEDTEDKSLEFIGEDKIEHTPKDEKVRIYLGNAFDIIGERVQKNQHQLGKKSREETWEIKIRNHKSTAVKVIVVEHVWGYWEIRNKSHEYTKKDATTFEFAVDVPKDGETVINYTILKRW